ncbi:MAG: hypothetical protein IT451_06730 [Candidatus Brocadia sp.]|nr:hypothetical protein [Candidatus Brocadia sp.]
MRNRSILLLAGLLAAMLAMWFIDSSYLASEDKANRTQQNTTEHKHLILPSHKTRPGLADIRSDCEP